MPCFLYNCHNISILYFNNFRLIAEYILVSSLFKLDYLDVISLLSQYLSAKMVGEAGFECRKPFYKKAPAERLIYGLSGERDFTGDHPVISRVLQMPNREIKFKPSHIPG